KTPMNLTTFIEQRRPEWKALEALLEQVEGSGLAALHEQQAGAVATLSPPAAARPPPPPRLSRRAASDLNQAQTFVSGDATVAFLNDLVARCYLVIYAKTKGAQRSLFSYLFGGFPAVFRRHLRPVLLATAITMAGA